MSSGFAIGSALAGLLLAAPAARAELPPLPPQTVLWVNGGGLLFSNDLRLELEHAAAPWVSVFVSPGLRMGALPASSSRSVIDGMWGGSLELGARFYPLGEAPSGVFLGPLVLTDWTHQTDGLVETSGFSLGAGAVLGFTLFVHRGWALSAGAGGLYHRDELISGRSRTVTTGWAPTARLALGIGF